MQGTIYKINAGFFYIWGTDGNEYMLKGSGKLRQLELSPLVGDEVEFAPNGHVNEIKPRKNYLIRPKVANIDSSIIITSLVEPKYNPMLLLKFLCIMGINHIEPIIIFTKIDKSKIAVAEDYKKMGYKVFEISNVEKEHDLLKRIRKEISNKRLVLAGQSGSGKSSTINSLTGLTLETKKISKALGRGVHTTRVVEIIKWEDLELIDTPGFSSIDITLTKLELAQSIDLFRQLGSKCKFRSCLHYKETDCRVKDAVKNGSIPQRVYDCYSRLLEEAKND